MPRHGMRFLPGRAKKTSSGPTAPEVSARADCPMPVECLVRSTERCPAGRSSGFRLVTAPNCLPMPNLDWHSGIRKFGNLADHSGGPATELHRLPSSSHSARSPKEA
jgi:hypothetical protein